MPWIVARVIDESEDRTSADEVEGFINEKESEGYALMGMNDDFLFFGVRPAPPETPDQPVEEVEDEEDIIPEPEPTPKTRAKRALKTRKKAPRRARQPKPDPSIRADGQTEPVCHEVQVDPKALAGQEITNEGADPFGLG